MSIGCPIIILILLIKISIQTPLYEEVELTSQMRVLPQKDTPAITIYIISIISQIGAPGAMARRILHNDQADLWDDQPIFSEPK